MTLRSRLAALVARTRCPDPVHDLTISYIDVGEEPTNLGPLQCPTCGKKLPINRIEVGLHPNFDTGDMPGERNQ